jgi:hypothetical protein
MTGRLQTFEAPAPADLAALLSALREPEESPPPGRRVSPASMRRRS